MSHVKGKDVLDCGSVDHHFFSMKQARGDWLHGRVADHARFCVGVDILQQNVRRIDENGTYRIVIANVEALPFRNCFDVVVAGELVEHIYNMGAFLDSAWMALRPEGALVITTRTPPP